MISKFFNKLKNGLNKTRIEFTEKVSDILTTAVKIDDDLYEELEELLVTSDIGVRTSINIIERLKQTIKENKIKDPNEIKPCLKNILLNILENENDKEIDNSSKVILVIGVNGVGKTTSIGKMANIYKKQGKNVIIAAADTFRAAAIEQLQVWANRSGADIVKHTQGSDPAAVIFDAIQASKSRNTDVLICDTAGRLHNKKNLMNELGKINKIINREYSEAVKETLLVIDATTGQNGIEQAKQFADVCEINGIVLTKLDGSAKGGVVVSIKDELGIPVKYVGVGEQIDDFQVFNAKEYVDALFY